MISEHFVEPLVKQLEGLYSTNIPNLTVIMVNTKTSERFFTDGQAKNVTAGTLISEGLVSNFYDFYMVSQHSTRGSTLPNHYKIIFTNSKIE